MTQAMERGCHLILDGISRHLLAKSEIEAFLLACPKAIGLTIISGPHIYATDSGWAGIALVAESHVAVHTRGLEVYGDCFSCLPFSSRKVVSLAREMLALEDRPKVASRELQRGWASPTASP